MRVESAAQHCVSSRRRHRLLLPPAPRRQPDAGRGPSITGARRSLIGGRGDVGGAAPNADWPDAPQTRVDQPATRLTTREIFSVAGVAFDVDGVRGLSTVRIVYLCLTGVPHVVERGRNPRVV